MSTAPWLAWVATGIWIASLAMIAIRFRDTRSLDEHSAFPLPDAPLVSVIVPARNEAHNIERCLRSVLASTYASLEVIVVDDHSADGTGAIARRIAAEDPLRRARVIDAPPLPDGWFGKQWACHSGALAARGSVICFTDADTRHGPELLARSVNAQRERKAALFSVAGRQEMVTFWEKVVQPFVFAVLVSRYGGLDSMSRSTTPRDKITNGQFLLVGRDAYAASGGHEAVRHHVAEDLMMAQRFAELGMTSHLVLGRDHLSTRMYTSLDEIRRGWGKNVFAAGRDTLPNGPITRRLLPFIFPLPALVALLPTVAFVIAVAGLGGSGVLIFGTAAGTVNLLFWMGIYVFSRLNPLWALLHPLGALVFAWILAESAWRGSRVEWKGRAYESRSA